MGLDAEGERWLSGEVEGSEVSCCEARPRSGSNHGRVVSRERDAGKGDGQGARGGLGGEAHTQFTIGGDATGDEEHVRSEVFGGGKGLALEVVNDGALEGRDEAESLLIAERKRSRGRGSGIERGTPSLDG